MDADTLRYWFSVGMRRLPIFFVATFLCVFAGLMLIAVMPPVYRSAATIMLEPPQISPELARSTVPSDTLTQVAAIQEEVFLRDNLLELADRFAIYDEGSPNSDSDIVADLRDRIRFEFVKVGLTGEANGAATFSIAFEDRDPAKAAEIVNHLVAYILDKNVDRRTGRAGETLAFFEQEVALLGDRVAKAEADILTFKSENIGSLPQGLDFRYRQQSSEQDRLVQLEREEASLRDRRETLMLAGQSADPSSASARERKLDELRADLERQQAIFAPASPTVRDIRDRIAALENPDRLDEESIDGSVPLELRLQLSDIDGRLRFIESEKADIAEKLDQLQASIALTPGNETRLNRLMRTYDSARESYVAAVQRRAEASVGAQIETHLKGERLILLERPVVADKPIRPRRLGIATTSLAAGIGLGGVLALLVELLDGRVRRPAQIVHRLEMEPLATIPYIDLPGESASRRNRTLGMGAAAVGAVAVGLVFIHLAIMPLGAALLRILSLFPLPLSG